MKRSVFPRAVWLFLSLILGLGWLPSAASAGLKATRTVLPNGIILLHSEQKSLPLVTFSITFLSGAAAEPEEKAGLANLTAGLLREGTRKHTSDQLTEIIDRLGGRIGFSADRDTSSGGLTALKGDLKEGLRVLAEMLLSPTFPEEELKRKVRETIGQIERSKQNPSSQASVAFRRALYGSHPYGRRVVGEETTLSSITREDVVRFHRDHYRPKGTIVSVVGDVGPAEIRRLMDETFRGWSGAPAPVPAFRETAYAGPRKVTKISRPVTQARILFGHEGIRRDNPDFYAVRVMNYILGGGGFESRILKAIREERGLAYSAYSYFSTGLHGGQFQAGLGTRNATANQALDELFRQIERVRNQPVSEQELADAKSFLTGSFPLQLSGNRNIASFLTSIEMFHLGLDYIERYPGLINAVTRDDVLRVARRYLHPDKGILLILADEEKANLKY